jgi:TRAP-type C4-dicarboxylate transport system permease small subunit
VRLTERFVTGFARLICGISTGLVLLLPLPILYEIIMDQLQRPPVWVFEMTGYAIIAIAFCAGGYGLRTGHHFRISLLAHHWPSAEPPLRVLSAFLELMFGVLLAWAGWIQAQASYLQNVRSDTLLQIPQTWPELALPIGGVAIALQGLGNLLSKPNHEGKP